VVSRTSAVKIRNTVDYKKDSLGIHFSVTSSSLKLNPVS
jgi:hypothetical protein